MSFKARLSWELFPALWFGTAAALFVGLLFGLAPRPFISLSAGFSWIIAAAAMGGWLGAPVWRGAGGWQGAWRGALVLPAALLPGFLLWGWTQALLLVLLGNLDRAGQALLWAFPIALFTTLRVLPSALIVFVPAGMLSGALLGALAGRRLEWRRQMIESGSDGGD